jgi:hypothetical protein
LIGGTMHATDYAANLNYTEAHAKTTIQTVLLPRKEHEAIKATDEDAQKYYDANKEKDPDPIKKVAMLPAEMRSEPSRNFSYVKLTKVKRDALEDVSKLPADQQEAKKKEMEEKTKAWDAEDKKLSITAVELSNALVDAENPMTLAAAVASFKDKPQYAACEIKTVESIMGSNPPDDFKDLADPKAGRGAPGRKAAEILTEAIESDSPSGVLNSSTGPIIYEGAKTVASRLLTFDEAKAKLLEKLTREKIDAALEEKSGTVRSKLQETLAAGKPFAEALTAAGVTATTYAYSRKTPAKDAPPYLPAVQARVENLETGAITANAEKTTKDETYDLVLAYLEKVELPQDPKMEDEKKGLKRTTGYTDQPFRQSPLFMTWFNQRREALSPSFGDAQ